MGKASQKATQKYKQLLKQKTPAKPLLRNVLAAFFVGGLIAAVGQVFLEYYLSRGMPRLDAVSLTAGTMVAIGAFLTGIGVYDKLGQFGGMGAALPITGFANSITAPAMEFKREGWVMGVGTRMFVIAGPVIVFGTVTAFLVALIRTAVRGGMQ